MMYVAKGSSSIPLSRAAGSGGMIPTALQILAPKASTTCLFFVLPSRLISWVVVFSGLSNRFCGTARAGSAAAKRAAHSASSRCTSPCILGATRTQGYRVLATLGLLQLLGLQAVTPMNCYLTDDTICGQPVYIGMSLRQSWTVGRALRNHSSYTRGAATMMRP